MKRFIPLLAIALLPAVPTLAQIGPPELGSGLVFNEVYSGASGEHYVEIYNPTATILNTGDHKLTDGFLFERLPSAQLGPGGFAVFFQDEWGGASISSEIVSLFRDDQGVLVLVDQLGWSGGPGSTFPQISVSRVPDGNAVYTGGSGSSWADSGGGTALFYREPSPGLANAFGASTYHGCPDLNGDRILSLADIGPFSQDANGDYHCRSDFNEDGALNLADVGILSTAFQYSGAICDDDSDCAPADTNLRCVALPGNPPPIKPVCGCPLSPYRAWPAWLSQTACTD